MRKLLSVLLLLASGQAWAPDLKNPPLQVYTGVYQGIQKLDVKVSAEYVYQHVQFYIKIKDGKSVRIEMWEIVTSSGKLTSPADSIGLRRYFDFIFKYPIPAYDSEIGSQFLDIHTNGNNDFLITVQTRLP